MACRTNLFASLRRIAERIVAGNHCGDGNHPAVIGFFGEFFDGGLMGSFSIRSRT